MEGHKLIDSDAFNKLANNKYSEILPGFHF